MALNTTALSILEDVTSDFQTTISPTRSVEEEAQDYIIYWVGMYIDLVYFPTIVVLGSIGNVLSLLVMMQKANRSLSCSWYISVLAVTDICLLYVYVVLWLGGLLGTMDDSFCRICTIFFNWSSNSSTYLIIALTFDRFLAIRYPLKFTALRTPKNARRIILVLLLLTTIGNVWHIFTSSLTSPTTCASFSQSKPYTKPYYFIHMSLFSFLPYITMFTFNILIIRTMQNRNKYFDQVKKEAKNKDAPYTIDKSDNTNISNKKAKSQNVDKQLTIMLMSVSFAFLLLTLPLFIRYFIYMTVNPKRNPPTYAMYMFLYNFSNKSYMTNNAINFYLYCITGSKFRRDLVKLFQCDKSSTSSDSYDTTNLSVISS